MWAGEATPLLGPEGPLPAGGRDSIALLLYKEKTKQNKTNPKEQLPGFRQMRIFFLVSQLRLKEHYSIFDTFSTSAAEGIDGTCSLP